MAKAQNIQFKSIDEMLAYLPPAELEMTQILRNLIYDCVPKVKEKLGWNVSSFHHYSGLCLVWPGSIDWMGKTRPGRVDISFMKGQLLQDRGRYLNKGTRTLIASRYFLSPGEINLDQLAEVIYEAADFNYELFLEKRRK
jgi:hypothetical protein